VGGGAAGPLRPHPPAATRKATAVATKAPATLTINGTTAGGSPVPMHLAQPPPDPWGPTAAAAPWGQGAESAPAPGDLGPTKRFRRRSFVGADAAPPAASTSASAAAAAPIAVRPPSRGHVRGPASLWLGGLGAGDRPDSLPSSPSSQQGAAYAWGHAWDEAGARPSSLPAALGQELGAGMAPCHSPGTLGGGVVGGRPTSARTKAVQMLVESVRSRDDGQLQDTLAYLVMPNSSVVAGLNDRHPITGRSALHEAVQLNSLPAVQRLLAAGSNPNVGHPQAGTPLLHAAACGLEEAARALLGAGADVAAVDAAGWSALHHACAGGHVGTARLLVQHNASMSARTFEEEAPMDLARPGFAQALCDADAGAGVGGQGGRGRLSSAVQRGGGWTASPRPW
jgi:hypothetical protein